MEAIDLLLDIELASTLKAIGLQTASEREPTEDDIYRIINTIELLLIKGGQEHTISALCGLLWTHFAGEYDLVGEYIYTVMARIGFSPVSTMLGTDKSEGRVAVSSMLPGLESELNSLTNSVRIFNRTYKLTSFQKRLWDAIERANSVAISAPTSAGKSFLICLNLVYGMSRMGGVSVYLVPNLTLMNQVASDLISIANRQNITINIETHLSADVNDDIPVVYVLTQERAVEYARLFPAGGSQLTYLVVDEVQNLERAFDFEGDDHRAKLLLDVIIEMHDECAPKKTVISGPRISEIQKLSQTLFQKKCESVVAVASPVANVCYSIHPAGNKIEIRQYSDLLDKHRSVFCANSVQATGFGKSRYNDRYHRYLLNVLRGNPGTLVFSPTSGQCRQTASSLADNQPILDDERASSLANYVRDTVSEKYDLAKCVERGVAFHHGKMPHHLRNAVEFAVGQSLFTYVVCTTTLTQGVNIPARNVVLRNPNLFVQSSEKPKLSNYEIANLRGRAGRLLRDFVGRTFILDGTSFEEQSVQTGLFEAPHKKVDGSYSKVFSEHREEIVQSLVEPANSSANSSIATYIANVLFTERDGLKRLERKGITLSRDEERRIERSLSRLVIPKDICRKHRYWSPFALDRLYQHRQLFTLPNSPFSEGARDKLGETLTMMLALLPEQCRRYLGKRNCSERVMWVLAKQSIKWSQEVPLKELLAEPYSAKNNDNTDATINMLQNTISFGIPSLLSPIYSMLLPESSLLVAVEAGAHSPAAIAMLNHNVPRETALAVRRIIGRRRIEDMDSIIRVVRQNKLSFWDAIQFKHIVDPSEITQRG